MCGNTVPRVKSIYYIVRSIYMVTMMQLAITSLTVNISKAEKEQ